MIKRMLCMVFLFQSCITVTTVTVGQKTSLERQLMGDFEPLTEEEVLTTSVRSFMEDSGSDSTNTSHHDAVSSRKRQLYNKDDVKEFKSKGCLYEQYPAVLKIKECSFADQESKKQLIARIVKEENEDRQKIIQWVEENNKKNISDKNVDVHALFHSFLFQTASKKDLFLEKNGTWVQK